MTDYESVVHQAGVVCFSALPGSNEQRSLQLAWIEKLNGVLDQETNKSLPDHCIVGSALLFLQELPQELLAMRLAPTKKRCQTVTKNSTAIIDYHLKLTLEICRELISQSVQGRKKHRHRRNILDQAIKRLLVLDKNLSGGTGSGHSDDVRVTLAGAYHLRGRLIYQKGFSTPAKKVETLHCALSQLDSIVTPTEESHRLRAIIHDDLAKLSNSRSDLDSVLNEVLPLFQPDPRRNREDILILLARAEAGDSWAAESPGRDYLVDVVDDQNEVAMPLDKARAWLCLADRKKAAVWMRKALQLMTRQRRPFSDDDWQVSVDLLARLYKSGPDEQEVKEAISTAWEAASALEYRAQGLHVRWYWSRQRHLYDLAFHAADNDLARKAKIADSLKSRFALHLEQAEALGIDEEYIEEQKAGLLGRYIVWDDKPTRQTERPEKKLANGWPEISAPWLCAHFYLGSGFADPNGKKKGYVLIYNANNQTWKEQQFNYETIFDAYMDWQENYQRVRDIDLEVIAKKNAAESLEELCRVIGREMIFLFDQTLFPDNVPVILIPHDFFHRLPIHAAIQEMDGQRNLFAASHPSVYLPAWWMAPEEGVQQQPSPVHPTQATAIVFWENWEHELKKVTTQVGKEDLAEADDLLALAQPPRQLVIKCHGQADAANPFLSRLKLSPPGLTLAELLGARSDLLTGTDVVLSVCETDLMLPVSTPLDEHLTLSSALLQKGADTVVGALWQVSNTEADNLAYSCVTSGHPAHEVVQSWSGAALSPYIDDPRPELLYMGAAFRVLGVPTIL